MCGSTRPVGTTMSTASSSPPISSTEVGMADADASEKQLSRCEEMVQYSLQRCERRDRDRVAASIKSVRRDRLPRLPQLMSGVEAHEAHCQWLCGNLGR